VSEKVADRTGDAVGSGPVLWDLTAMTVTRDTAGVTVRLEFSSDLISPTSGDPNAMIGFVDFDTDQDPSTGVGTAVDEFRRDGGSTGMDADYILLLTAYAADSSVPVFKASVGEVGRVKPVFNGKQVSIRIPKALLGNDDGFLNAAAIVGVSGGASDIVPDNGHLELTETPPAAMSRSGVSAVPRGASEAVTRGVRWVPR